MTNEERATAFLLRCNYCGKTTAECHDGRMRGHDERIATAGEALDDDEGWCCEECNHCTFQRDALAAEFAAVRREALEEACRATCPGCAFNDLDFRRHPVSECRAHAIRALMGSKP